MTRPSTPSFAADDLVWMTRNICVSALICGSHICKVQPSEFDSIRVGPPSRPSTDTLSRQPSASIIGIGTSPRVLLFLERGKQTVYQRLRSALIGHRLEQFCQPVRAQMGGNLRVLCQHL